MSVGTLYNESYTFADYYNNIIELSFTKNPYSLDPRHVWVISKYNEQWLLTDHKDRGLEFPGGKVEKGETADQAALREINEETGGIINHLTYLGQYKVNAKSEIVIKNIYYAQIEHLEQKEHYFETNGPVLIKKLPQNIRVNNDFSFVMKDDVLYHCLQKLKTQGFR